MKDLHYERVCALTLNRIFGFNPKISYEIMTNLGSASAVFALQEAELRSLFGPFSKVVPRISEAELEVSGRELDRIEAEGCRFIHLLEDDYPEMLRDCPDPPAGLYIRCTDQPAAIFGSRPLVSIVGTRDISAYGSEWCRKIVHGLSESPSQPCIVSGLAFGVDVCAHQAALESGLPTIAVIPTGIDAVYPSSHRRIASTIAATPGSAVITDYPCGTGAQKINFLRRNRIIAALGTATILIESKVKGGGLMTANLASSYGREVYALPGRIEDVRSEGCNALLRSKTAEPITSIEGLVSDLGLKMLRPSRAAELAELLARRYSPRPDFELIRDVALQIKKMRGSTPEDICGRLGITYQEASRCAFLLENDGLVSIDLSGRCSIVSKIM